MCASGSAVSNDWSKYACHSHLGPCCGDKVCDLTRGETKSNCAKDCGGRGRSVVDSTNDKTAALKIKVSPWDATNVLKAEENMIDKRYQKNQDSIIGKMEVRALRKQKV